MDKCRKLSGFYPPKPRGFTHQTIGVSPTESRGFTHRAIPKTRGKQPFSGAFFRLNLFNSFYLTESFNGSMHPTVCVQSARRIRPSGRTGLTEREHRTFPHKQHSNAMKRHSLDWQTPIRLFEAGKRQSCDLLSAAAGSHRLLPRLSAEKIAHSATFAQDEALAGNLGLNRDAKRARAADTLQWANGGPDAS